MRPDLLQVLPFPDLGLSSRPLRRAHSVPIRYQRFPTSPFRVAGARSTSMYVTRMAPSILDDVFDFDEDGMTCAFCLDEVW
jgi:hypothetical protein